MNEGLTRPDVTAAVTRGVLRMFAAHGLAGILEMPLGNGRRADVVALTPQGRIWIVEVKSCAADYGADSKWTDYLDYADAFFFAAPPEFPQALLPSETGLIVADNFGGEIIRSGPELVLAPARRKAMTLAFARLAAARLFAKNDA
jgi:hypothetical protein